MVLKSLTNYDNSLWDWDIVNDVLPGRIRMSDVEGIVEISDQFLLVEGKFPGTAIPEGQARLHAALRRTGVFTVVYIWGKKTDDERYITQVERMRVDDANGTGIAKPATTEDFRRVVSRWVDRVQPKKEFDWVWD